MPISVLQKDESGKPVRNVIFEDNTSEEEMKWVLDNTPIFQEKAPESPTLERLKMRKATEGMNPLIKDKVSQMVLEKRYGYIAEDPFDPLTALSNVPHNVEEIVNDIGSLIAGTALFAGRFGKNLIQDINEFAAGHPRWYNLEPQSLSPPRILPRVRGQFEPATDLGRAIYYDFKAVLAGEVPTEVAGTPLVEGTQAYIDYLKEKIERQGLGKTLAYFIQDNPVDAMLLVTAIYDAAAIGTRLTAEAASKMAVKGSRIAIVADEILSTKRTPLVYDVSQTKAEEPKVITYSREYSKDPLTKYLFQESFDAVLEKYPKMADWLAKRKTKKLLWNLRVAYEDANFQERARMHAEIFKKLEALDKDERKVLAPYLEGRARLMAEPSEQFQNFENWYRDLFYKTQEDLIERGKLSVETIDKIRYQPLQKATGQTIEQIKAELGDFSPIYVHHTFPKIYEEKTGIHFAETTGRRFKPSWLKRREGKWGYSENMEEILPKFFSEYTKYKNTEAFLSEFTTRFGVKVNIKDVEHIEDGLKVGDVIYPNHKIVAPDGFLRFYKAKVDIYKEISKRMKNTTFEEAVGEVLTETIRTETGAGTVEELSKAGKMIENRVREALTSRGFSVGETDQMIERLRSGESSAESVIKVIVERTVTKTKGGPSAADVLSEVSGLIKEYIGVSKSQTVYLVPSELTKELQSFATPLFGSTKAQDAIRLVVDRPTQVWKDLVLAATPRWIKNNVIGDIIFSIMEGVGPFSYSRAFRDIYVDTIPDELLEASFANLMKYNPQLGKTAETTFGQLVDQLYSTKAVRGLGKAKDLGYSINTAFEQPFVRALYVKLAREKAVSMLKVEGLKRTEVNILNKMRVIKENPELHGPLIDHVKETLPVFNLLGPNQRKYLRRIAPFTNWYKFMVQYSAKLPAKHPFKTIGARGLGALAENQREEAFKMYFPFMEREINENGIPQRFNGLWPVGEITCFVNPKGEIKFKEGSDKAMFFNVRGMNPFATVEDLLKLDVIHMASPVFTIPYERITGRKAFGGGKFESGAEGIHYRADGTAEFRDFEKVRPPLWDHILSQFIPQYPLAKQILVPAQQFDTGTILNPDPKIDPETGEYKYPIESIDKILNYMGVDRKTLDIYEVWEAFLKRKKTALGRALTKEESKNRVSFEDIRQMFEKVGENEVLMRKIQSEMQAQQEKESERTLELLRKIEEELVENRKNEP